MVITCTNCEQELPESDFSYQKRYPDKLYKWCDECRESNVYIPKNNPETKPAPQPEVPEGMSVGMGMLWLKAHRANQNKPKKSLSHYELTVVKPKFERMHIERAARYGGRGATTATALTYEQWIQVREYYGGQCLRCGKKGDLRCDHAKALYAGGANEVWNIQVLCQDCNTWKSALSQDFRTHYPRFMLEFMQENGIALSELFDMRQAA